jgi:hypothetical protein
VRRDIARRRGAMVGPRPGGSVHILRRTLL